MLVRTDGRDSPFVAAGKADCVAEVLSYAGCLPELSDVGVTFNVPISALCLHLIRPI